MSVAEERNADRTSSFLSQEVLEGESLTDVMDRISRTAFLRLLDRRHGAVANGGAESSSALPAARG